MQGRQLVDAASHRKDEVAAFATEWIPVMIGEAINKDVLEDVD